MENPDADGISESASPEVDQVSTQVDADLPFIEFQQLVGRDFKAVADDASQKSPPPSGMTLSRHRLHNFVRSTLSRYSFGGTTARDQSLAPAFGGHDRQPLHRR
jgi:hypothetical protein